MQDLKRVDLLDSIVTNQKLQIINYKYVEKMNQDEILLVMGGFHLEWATAGKIEKIISAFKQMGVRYVGHCHCSGDKARSLFEKHFGENYINIGAGKVISLADLQ